MASGLTLAFGVMRVVNVAQGALIVLGAYLSYTLFTWAGIDPFLSILIMTPLMFALGVALQLAFLRPLRSDEREQLSLLVTWAIALGIEGVLSVIYQTTYRVDDHERTRTTRGRILGYVSLAGARATAFLTSLVILTAALPAPCAEPLRAVGARDRAEPASRRSCWASTRSAWRRSDSGSASRRPPRPERCTAIVFPFNPGSHYDLISRLLSIIVLGGLGSLGGAVVASLVVGVSEAIAGGRDLADLGLADLLPRPDRGAARAAAGAVRPRRARGPVRARYAAGLGRALGVFVAADDRARSSSASTGWSTSGSSSLMYAALATAWNLIGGFSGYLSLGHVGVLRHRRLRRGHRVRAPRPRLRLRAVPAGCRSIGIGVALVAVPARVARAAYPRVRRSRSSR